jgi:hypothetical protein
MAVAAWLLKQLVPKYIKFTDIRWCVVVRAITAPHESQPLNFFYIHGNGDFSDYR